MRHALAVLLLSVSLFAQTPDQPGVQYSAYTILLVNHGGGEGMMVGVDKQKQIVFVPISQISKAVSEQGVSPVSYGELLQLLHQLGEENQRLKAENDHLWKVAEGHPGATAPATTVVVQQQAPPRSDPDAERRQMRMMLLQSLLAPKSSTVNLNVRDCARFPALCVNQ